MEKAMMATVAALAAVTLTAQDVNYRNIAEQAIREAAAKQAQESASWEKSARETAEKAAKETAEAAVKAAVEKAAKEAAVAAAEKAATEAAAKYTDEKAAKEEMREERKRIETKIFKLNHADAKEVAEKFNEMWNGDFGVTWKLTKMAVAFEESNSIMITAPKTILDACEKSLSELDVEAPQVYIEARFVELGNDASHKVGIDWQMLDGMKGSANLAGGLQSTRLGKGVMDYTVKDSRVSKRDASYSLTGAGSSDGDIKIFEGTLSFSEMSLVLSALDESQDTKTFSNPKIIVSSGKKAMVDMTTKYPNVQVAAKKTFNTSGESTDLDMKMAAIPGEDKFMFAKEAFFSWGIQLEVVPRIGTNGLINVEIVPTISQLDRSYGEGGFVTAGNADSGDTSGYSSKYPIIEVKRLVTEFNMKSGSTAVIGGLSITEETQRDTGIPVLREIPWLGPRLFGSMTRVKEQKEIIVFVTVGLINPREMKENAGLPKNAILGRQYTKGLKLEPGDKPEKNMEGFDSLDLRSLEEQAQDPLKLHTEEKKGFRFGDYVPFTKDKNATKAKTDNTK